jgi:hypothetical protein
MGSAAESYPSNRSIVSVERETKVRMLTAGDVAAWAGRLQVDARRKWIVEHTTFDLR